MRRHTTTCKFCGEVCQQGHLYSSDDDNLGCHVLYPSDGKIHCVSCLVEFAFIDEEIQAVSLFCTLRSQDFVLDLDWRGAGAIYGLYRRRQFGRDWESISFPDIALNLRQITPQRLPDLLASILTFS